MKMALLSPYENITNLGTRGLSSYIKAAGHQSKLIFAPIGVLDGGHYSYLYKLETIEEILGHLEDVDLVGMSVMTHHFQAAVQLTDAIHERLGKTVLWGGIHPTARPEESIEHADIICRGEGEIALLDLLDRMERDEDLTATQNFWFRRDGEVHQNPSRPLIQDLDSLPFMDYSCDEHYYIDDASSSTTQMTHENLKEYLQVVGGRVAYRTVASRGCPHNCSYCCHNVLRRIYTDRTRYVRFRSPENIMAELTQIKEAMGYVRFIIFMDEVFLLSSKETIREFSDLYKERIGDPFRIQLSPPSIDEEKLGMLVDAGCKVVGMGIESGSKDTQDLYERGFGKNEKVIRGANIIHKFHEKVPFIIYDIIVDNPYESPENVAETFRLLMRLPRPYQINLFSLTFFPGTDLYTRAIKDGYVREEIGDIYQKMISSIRRNYVNTILKLTNLQVTPTFLLRPLGHPWMVRVMNRAPEKVVVLLEKSYMLIEKVLAFGRRRGDLIPSLGIRSTTPITPEE
ncbi:MAG: B12-binding domain-containing radical SAM protein [Dehalococcoidia bacterium]